jgi:hypothetical protein
VFEGAKGPVMAAWARPRAEARISLGAKVRVIRTTTGEASTSEAIALTPSPVLVLDLPAAIVAEARANARRPFPWGGDYSRARSVAWEAPGTERGLHPLGEASKIAIGGLEARDISKGSSLAFTVDPNFLSYTTVPIQITAVVRRNGPGGAGFNLKYESTSGWRSTGSWTTIPPGEEWTTLTWTIADPQLVGKWGYHFSLDSDSTQHSQYSLRSVTVSKE